MDIRVSDDKQGRRGWLKLLLCVVAFLVFTLVQSLAMYFGLVLLPGDTLMNTAIVRFVIAVLVCGLVALLGGGKWLSIDKESIAYAFRRGWMLLLLPIVPGCSILFNVVTGRTPVEPGALMRLLAVVLLCAGIGIFEEGMHRGVILNGLLAPFGTSRKGVMAAVILSSLFFGYAHTVPDDWASLATSVQALLKVGQTALFGIVMADGALHSRKLGGIALFHAVNDALYMLSSIVAKNGVPASSYTSSDSTGGFLVLVYVGMIVVSALPAYWSARAIWKEHESCRGAFME